MVYKQAPLLQSTPILKTESLERFESMSDSTIDENPNIIGVSFAQDPKNLELVDAQSGVYQYVGKGDIGFGAMMSSDTPALVRPGDYVIRCINQYKDYPQCDELIRCHASFETTQIGSHDSKCACGVCGIHFKCVSPGICKCEVTKMDNQDDEACVIM